MPESVAIMDVEIDEPIVTTRKERRARQQHSEQTRRQPPYAVIVHNDELHTFPYVIELLQKVCGHQLAAAMRLTSTIHYAGRAVVWTGTLELAELKRDQIRGYGPDRFAEATVEFPLGVTVEPLPGD